MHFVFYACTVRLRLI